MSYGDEPPPPRGEMGRIACAVALVGLVGPPVLAFLLHAMWPMLGWVALLVIGGVLAKAEERGRGGMSEVNQAERSVDSLGKTSVRGHRGRGEDRGSDSAPSEPRRGTAVGMRQAVSAAPTVTSVADPGLVRVGRPDGSVWGGYVGPPVKLNDPRQRGANFVQVEFEGDLRWVRLDHQVQASVTRMERDRSRVRSTPRRREGAPVWQPGAEDSPVDERGRFRPGNGVAASRQRDKHGRFVPKTVPQDTASQEDVPQDSPSHPAPSQEDSANA